MTSGTPNVRGLEGKSTNGEDEEDSKTIQPREFFWDSITLYVVFAIVSLSSIDLIIEFIRQPEVRCFSRNNQTELADYQDYVNEFCYGTSALSNINIFRICSYILGFGIAALHYLWLNHFGGRFAFFFQLVSDIKRRRNEETGDYPKDNQIIADQLEDSFTTFKQNSIFWVYLAKLLLQLLLSVAGVAGIGYYFTRLRFDTSFYCPETFEDTLDLTGPWPLTGEQVTCVYTSFPLLELICIADMALLALAIILLTASLVWCSASHSKQLGYKVVAMFVFQTGLPSRYFVPDFKLPKCQKSYCCFTWCQKLYLCFSSIPWFPWRGPRIDTDLDFMMMRLFRTDGGLGHVLKEVLILKEVKNLNDNDLQRYALHSEEQTLSEFRTADLISRSDEADLKWIFDKNKPGSQDEVYSDGVYNPAYYGQMPKIPPNDEPVFRMPNSVRGAVLGFSSYVRKRNFALCISFGSPSTGFATALARVYSKVVSINFSPYFYNRTNDKEEKEKEKKKETKQPQDDDDDDDDDSEDDDDTETVDQVTVLTCAEDVLANDKSKGKFMQQVKRVWDDLKVNFILLSPLNRPIHKSTVTYFIYLLKANKFLAEDAVLLTMYPMAISGRYLSLSDSPNQDHQQQHQDTLEDEEKEFYQYLPQKFFPSPVVHKVQMVKRKTLVWPKFDTKDNSAGTEATQSADNLPVRVVSANNKFEMKTNMRFRMFSRKKQPPKPSSSGTQSTGASVLSGSSYQSVNIGESTI